MKGGEAGGEKNYSCHARGPKEGMGRERFPKDKWVWVERGKGRKGGHEPKEEEGQRDIAKRID